MHNAKFSLLVFVSTQKRPQSTAVHKLNRLEPGGHDVYFRYELALAQGKPKELVYMPAAL